MAISDDVKAIIANVTGLDIEEVSENMPLAEICSIDIIDVTLRLEKYFGIRGITNDIKGMVVVGDIINYFRQPQPLIKQVS